MKKIKLLPKYNGHKGPVIMIEGKQYKANDIAEVKDDVAADLLYRGKAELVAEVKEVKEKKEKKEK